MGAAENAALAREYLARVSRGDPSFADLLADDVVWWTPPGSNHGGGAREGKPAVLAFMREGSRKYAAPLQLEVEQVVADEAWAAVQVVLHTRTPRDEPFTNYLHIAFRFRDGRIVLAREYSDTQRAAGAFTAEELA